MLTPENDLHSIPYIHTYIHACMHAYIYIYIRSEHGHMQTSGYTLIILDHTLWACGHGYTVYLGMFPTLLPTLFVLGPSLLFPLGFKNFMKSVRGLTLQTEGFPIETSPYTSIQ